MTGSDTVAGSLRLPLLTALVAIIATGAVQSYMLGSVPGPEVSGADVVRWFATQRDAVRWSVWSATIAAPAFAVLIALLRATLPSIYKDVFLLGAVCIFVTAVVQNWVWAALALRGTDNAPEVARALLDVAIFFGPLLTGAWITLIAPVATLAIRRRAALPRWLGIFGILVVAEQAIETVTIFGSTGFTAPGGMMNMGLGAALTLLWTAGFGLHRAFAANGTTSLV